MSYAELAARVPHRDVEAISREIAAVDGLDLPERAKRVTAAVWAASGLAGPAVVMGFGSIPYPAVSLSDAVLEEAILAAAAAQGLTGLRYFPGISDMSFLGHGRGEHRTVGARLSPADGACARAIQLRSCAGARATGRAGGTRGVALDEHRKSRHRASVARCDNRVPSEHPIHQHP